MKLAAVVLLAAGVLLLIASRPVRSGVRRMLSGYRRRQAEERIERELSRLAA